jgi:hypothetical protein
VYNVLKTLIGHVLPPYRCTAAAATRDLRNNGSLHFLQPLRCFLGYRVLWESKSRTVFEQVRDWKVPVCRHSNGSGIYSGRHELHYRSGPRFNPMLHGSEFVLTTRCQSLCLCNTGHGRFVSDQ